MKKIVAFLLCFLMIFSFVPATSAAELSEVEQDISRMQFDGKAWDPQAFLEGKDEKSVYLMAVDEHGLRYSGTSSAYGFYLYLFNPSGKKMVTNSSKNKVQMAVSWKDGRPDDYEKFDLKPISISEDGKYLKYKVVDHVSAVDNLSMQGRMQKMQLAKSERVYKVTGVELLGVGSTNATDYSTGCTVTVTGFEANLGKTGNNVATKKMTYSRESSLELDVVQCFWRSQSSSLGSDYKNQINGAYFAVPNDVWDQYEALNSIKCEWYEYKTRPMIITDDQKLFDSLFAVRGISYDGGVSVIPCTYELYYDLIRDSLYPPSLTGSVKWGFNIFNGSVINDIYITKVHNRLPLLTWVFLSKEAFALNKSVVSREEILDYYHKYKDSLDLLTSEVDSGRQAGYNSLVVDASGFDDNGKPLFPLDNYDSTHTKWEKIFDYNIWNGGKIPFKGYTVDTGETYNHMRPFEVFRPGSNETNALLNTLTLEEICDQHFLNDTTQAANFKKFVADSIKNDCTVVMMRYAETDYYAKTLEAAPQIDGHVMMAQQTMFLDFDVIYLGFTDSEQNLRIVSVSNDPEDATGDGQLPPTTDTDPDLVVDQAIDEYQKSLNDLIAKLKGSWGKAKKWLGIVLLVALGVGLIALGVYVYRRSTNPSGYTDNRNGSYQHQNKRRYQTNRYKKPWRRSNRSKKKYNNNRWYSSRRRR